MKLSELAFACYLYGKFTDYDDSYLKFLQAINNKLDLKAVNHRKELLKWLNKWGCRQFKLENHNIASNEILTWFLKYNNSFFDNNKNLWDITNEDLTIIKETFDSLANKTASIRNRSGNEIIIKVGPTGTSKILFALTSNALPPWDQPIREYYEYDGSGLSYCQYLKDIQLMLNELELSCHKNGFSLQQLPNKLTRPNSTVPKLIDEYNWVIITRKCEPPTQQTLRNWLEWY